MRSSARSPLSLSLSPLLGPGECPSYPACDKLQYARFACKCRAMVKNFLTVVLSAVTTEIRAARNPARRKNLRGHANSFAKLYINALPREGGH